jgi:hypothetical protein
MSRSFGDDVAASIGVIAEPEVTYFELDSKLSFVLLASDGVWEFLSDQDVVDSISRHMQKGASFHKAVDRVAVESARTPERSRRPAASRAHARDCALHLLPIASRLRGRTCSLRAHRLVCAPSLLLARSLQIVQAVHDGWKKKGWSTTSRSSRWLLIRACSTSPHLDHSYTINPVQMPPPGRTDCGPGGRTGIPYCH